jgi:hydrogenase maturation protease
LSALVAGLGNSLRRDDGVGVAVAELVRAAVESRSMAVTVVQLDGEAARLLDAWDGTGLAIVVDAERSASPPGSVRRIEGFAPWTGPGSPPALGSHAGGLPAAVALGTVLGRLPGRLVTYAVSGGDFDVGPGLSPPVAAAASRVAALILRELGTNGPNLRAGRH